MGNAQSQPTEAPRRTSHRLSKPNTGNHATAGLLSPNSTRRLSHARLPPNPPAPSSTAASTPTTLSAVDVSGGLDRRIDSVSSLHSTPGSQRESKRRSLFRSRSSRGADPGSQSHSGGPGSQMADRMTKANSMTYESTVAYYGQTGPEGQLVRSDSRASWNYNLTSYEAKRLLNLAEEPGLEQAAAMSENRMTVVTETTWNSSNPAHSPSAPITRANSDVSLYMPVRRRSIIQTPGVATRSASARDLPPLPQPNPRYSHPPTPTLTRQHSVESYRSGVMSMSPRVQDPDTLQRVVTPCEDKYMSIGAFKLGSLRITNGSPSPLTPGIDMARLSGGHAIARDDYFAGVQAPEASDAPVKATQRPSQSPKFLPQITQSPSGSVNELQPASPALQTTSKHTALEDELFDDELQLEYSSLEVLDVRLDPNAKPPHTEAERDSEPSVKRTDSGFVSTTSPASEISLKPLAKADSGYSSIVSLRSFQSKARTPESQTETLDLAKTEREPSPPPVPPKDPARNSLIAQSRSDLTARNNATALNSATESRMDTSKTGRHAPSPTVTLGSGHRGPASPEREIRSPRSAKSSASDHSSSALSSGGRSPRPSKLQRFLSSARRPAAGPPVSYTPHAPKQASVPTLPQDVEKKPREHSGRFPSTAKKLALKSRSSMDTLKTIFSVGSFETNLDAVNSKQNAQAVRESESKEGAWKQTLTSVPTSIANAAAHVIPKKASSRKLLPVRQDSTAERDQGHLDDRGNDAAWASSPVESDASVRSPKSMGRTMSLTFFGERGMNPRHRASDANLTRSSTALASPAFPSPVAKAMTVESSGRMPRPLPSATKPVSLRVPPPLRSQSSTASLSRKASRESIQSYSARHALANKSSMDSVRSHYSSHPGSEIGLAHSSSTSGISMDPRRLQAFRKHQSTRSSPYITPSWDLQTDHGVARGTSQTFTATSSRHNSISSIHSEGGSGPGSAHGWHVRTPQRPLRHRASYDGYSSQPRHPQYGYPPSMSNGYTAPQLKPLPIDPRSKGQLDAAATWSRSQADAAAGQWYQGGGVHQQQQPPPYVPRGHHHRNRSMGNRPNHLPYRVLHSYNSPAYRHAPIWG